MKIEEMIAANRADCSGCEACANICPKNAITMTRDAEGFAYPKINPELCIKCGRCDATCPSLNFIKKDIEAFPETFAATYPDEKILRRSSSGGTFTALSEIILKSGGVVFGAGFDKNFRVVHTSAKNLDELENLRGSKYVQSQIGDVYRQVRDALKSTSVLFCGTSCQCAGLKHFLGKDFDNLLTVAIICHGVPSPALWENYIAELGYAHEIKHVNFRSKRNGWGGSNIEINFADRGYYFKTFSKDLYGKVFYKGISERPSCHSCKFKFPNILSDLTLGDAWGIQKFAPEMYDKRGVSLVIVHTPKGKRFLEETNLKMQSVKFIDAASNNNHIVSASIADSRREKFFSDLAQNEDKFAVLQEYYDQDDEEIRKGTGKKKRDIFQKNIRDLAAQIRRHFTKNILVMSSPHSKGEQKILENFLEQDFKDCGVYILQPKEDDQFVCTETFSLLTTDLKDAKAISAFVRKYNITEIYIENMLKFGDSSSQIINRLKTFDVPVKFFNLDRE